MFGYLKTVKAFLFGRFYNGFCTLLLAADFVTAQEIQTNAGTGCAASSHSVFRIDINKILFKVCLL